MSTQSRLRDTKRPNPQCRTTHQPGQSLGLIPFKATGLFRVQSSKIHHNGRPHGKFSGITRLARFIREMRKRIQLVAP